MADQYLTWQEAFQRFACDLTAFQIARSAGLNVTDAGAAVGVSAETAQAFETAISRLLAAVENETAPVAPGAAQHTHTNTREGVTAP